jgi:transcription elongation GreA/GreB family factor
MGLVRLSENMKFNIAKGTLLPTYMNEEQFDEWSADIATKSVDSETAKAKATKGKRGPADARSFKELYLSLKEFHKENSGSDFKFSEEEVEKLKQFFSKETIHITDAEVLMLAESISFIVDFSTDEVVLDMMTPMLGKYSFWAEHPESIALVDLEIWGKIPAKRLPQFIKATELLHSEDYIARYITVLPMRCLNSLCDHVNHDLIKEKVLQSNNLTSDIILWVWKNRKKKSKDLLDIVSIENVVTAVSTINLPQVWLVAQRDLKKNFIGDEEFQKLLIDNAVTPASLAFAIQSCNALTRGERSSLIVKLSKLSEEFKDYFESSGRAEQILGTSKEVNTKAKVSNEPILTSIASYKKKQAELENIISVELPENKEAISVAREHGDLKENSEYKYAKQQQRFLNSRCADLEKELGMAQAIDFSDIKVADSAVLGSTVEVKYDDDSKDTFYIVGAWDGDVADDAVSYKAPISEFLLNKKVGDKVELPSSGGSSKVGSVTSIKALPKKVLKELVG